MKNRSINKSILPVIVLIAVFAVAPLVVGVKNNYMINILCSFCYYGIMCCSLNLLLGFTGQISMGHAAFMMIGGYTYAILVKFHGVNIFLAVAAAMILSFLSGLLLGAACCKLNAIFLAMTTVGFYRAVSTTIINEGWLTGGPEVGDLWHEAEELAVLLYMPGRSASGIPVLLSSHQLQDGQGDARDVYCADRCQRYGRQQ